MKLLLVRTIQEEKARSLQRKWHQRPEIRKRQTELNKLRKYRIKKEIMTRLGGKCVCCGLKEWWILTIDHITPIKNQRNKYDSDWWQTLYFMKDISAFQCLCHGCNSSKGKREKCTLPHGVDLNK